MEERTWLETATAIASIATPFLIAGLGAVGWRIRARLERQAALEDQLREDRIALYDAILEPFILVLVTDEAWQSDPKRRKQDKQQVVEKILLSVEYRKQAFRMSLIGSDEVVKAYNNLMQFFYSREDREGPSPLEELKTLMVLLGEFLLAIRKSTGNESTKLDSWDMLEWFLKDVRKYLG